MSALKARHEKQPWTPADATSFINELGKSSDLDILATDHADEQMALRGLIMGDVLHALKRGYVYAEPEPATRKGLYKYAIESRTPNSGARDIRVIVIPDCQRIECKIITVMWKDES